jgi:hypothetical protein
MPVVPVVAKAVLLLLHVPPVRVLFSAVVVPLHTLAAPVIGGGVAFTVTVVVVKATPQLKVVE